MTRAQEMTDLLHKGLEQVEQRIAKGIEENRKGDFTLQLHCAPGTKVTVKQLDHDFTIGANLFMLDQLETPEKNEKYKEHFAKCFNTATLPFYWNTLEPERGKPRFSADSPFIYRRPPIDPCIDFCKDHGITPKAHCLNYENFVPDWAAGATVEQAKRDLLTRFEVLAERYADKIPCWEVVNETLCNIQHTDFFNEDDFIEWSFAQADRLFPNNQLMINETTSNIFQRISFNEGQSNTRNWYYMLCKDSLNRGCRIDAIGLQYHYFKPAEDAVRYAKSQFNFSRHFGILDVMASLGKPLQITEVTIPAYDNNPEDYAMQAEVLRAFYRIWFSHPAMEGIIYWNQTDGYAHGAQPGDMTAGENTYRGGLLDFEMNPKPAYEVVYNMFHKEYHTEFTAEADANGQINFRGFYGTYEITVDGQKQTVQFKRNKKILKE